MTIETSYAQRLMQQSELSNNSTNRPTGEEEDIFTKMLGQMGSMPEAMLVKFATTEAKKLTENFAAANSDLANVKDPADMLAIQKKIQDATLSVDITAKVAGAVTQSVNKLTSLQ